MTEHHLETRGPAELVVEVRTGHVHVRATDTATTDVLLTGPDAGEVRVAQSGDRISVLGARHRGLPGGGDTAVRVDVTLPAGSAVVVRTGSADVHLEGPLGATEVRSGSGDVLLGDAAGPTVLETGSGDVRVGAASAELRIKSGSGRVHVGHVASDLLVSTGSGDVELRVSEGSAVLKTGSGDVRVGVPVGVPVWTDITTGSGRIRSDLPSTGAPAEGQPYVELRAKTGSGDVVLAPATIPASTTRRTP